MSINLSPFLFELTVGGIDRSDLLQEWQANDESADQRKGLILIQGKVVLRGNPNDAELLDPEINPSAWAYGTEVVYKVGSPLTVATRGRLYILKAVFNHADLTLELFLGCRLTLNRREVPANDKTGIRPGTETSRTTIIARLLAAAGITDVSIDIPDHPIDYPYPRTEGSYVDQAGIFAADALYCLWQDNTGTIVQRPIPQRIEDLPLSTPVLSTVDHLVEFETISGSETPTKTVKATGTWYRTTDPGDYFETRTNYAAGYKITKVRLDRATSRIIETSETWLPRLAVGTDPEQDNFIKIWRRGDEIILVERTEIIKFFERPRFRPLAVPLEPDASDQQRLIKRETIIERPLVTVIQPWLAERPDQAKGMYGRNDQYRMVIAEHIREEYTYYSTPEGEPGDVYRYRRLDTRLSASFDPQAGEGSGGDFVFSLANVTVRQTSRYAYFHFADARLGRSSGLFVVYEDITQVYRQLPRKDWVELETTVLRPAVVINPALREDKTVKDRAAYTLISDPDRDRGTRSESSNAGQLQPPRPEVFPAKNELETEDLAEEVAFSPIAGTFQEESRLREVPTVGKNPRQQLRKIAESEGTLVLGRYYGSNIVVPYDLGKNWKPFDRVIVVDGNRTKAYWLDAISHVSSLKESAISALGIFAKNGLWSTGFNYANGIGVFGATDLVSTPGYTSTIGVVGATEEITVATVVLLEQEFRECYPDEKSVICVSRGIFQWRSDTNPDNGDGSWTFLDCDGNSVTLTPIYAGTIEAYGSPTVIDTCSTSEEWDGFLTVPYLYSPEVLINAATPGTLPFTLTISYSYAPIAVLLKPIRLELPCLYLPSLEVIEDASRLNLVVPLSQQYAVAVFDLRLFKVDEVLLVDSAGQIPAFSRNPYPGSLVRVWIRNAAYHNRGSNPAITVSGSTVTWNASSPDANFALIPSTEVLVEYETLP